MIQRVQLLTDINEINRLYEFIKRFPLDYPDYFSWLEKCKRELETGYKKAFYALNSDKKIVGSIIFQQDKKDSSILELKNIRVDNEFRGDGIGSVLEILTELYAKEKGFKKIYGDTHPENESVQFLIKRGFRIESRESIYTEKEEVILSKII